MSSLPSLSTATLIALENAFDTPARNLLQTTLDTTLSIESQFKGLLCLRNHSQVFIGSQYSPNQNLTQTR
jgi:hypothetical protein